MAALKYYCARCCESPGKLKGYMENMQMSKNFPYNGKVARWWSKRAFDGPHAHAYMKIADFIRDSYVREPKLIVDYACGTGNLLFLLGRRFYDTKLVGLDGSSFLLGLALRRMHLLPRACARRIKLIKTPLPNMNLMRGQADLAVFCFPNMVFSSEANLSLSENDRKIARCLSLDDKSDNADSQAIQSGLEQGRVISRNLRCILARGGICVRVEYATIHRHELSARELTLVSFEEGSLDSRVEGMAPRLWFRVLASSFFRSSVLEDVYEQTADERDKNGGYLITVLKAL